MKYTIITILVLLLSNYANAQKYEPVFAKPQTVKDTFYHKYIVDDPYRWLEKQNSESTLEWVEQQKDLTKKYLRKPYNRNFTGINKYAATRYELPRKLGEFFVAHMFYNDLGQPALLYKRSLNFRWDILVDPNYISREDKITLKNWDISKDSKYLAFQFSRNGSDWAEAKIINTKTESYLDDHLTNMRFSGIEWRGEGFFYSKSKMTKDGMVPHGQQIYYHKLHTKQEEDELIFRNKRNPLATFAFSTTSNERFLIINEDAGKVNNLYYIDYWSDIKTVRPLVLNLDFEVDVLDSYDGQFIIKTFKDDCNGMLLKIDPKNPRQWKTIVPPFEKAILTNALPFEDRIVAIYHTTFKPIIAIYDYNGELLKNIPLPSATSPGGFSANYEDDELYYYWQTYTIPKIVYKINIKTFEEELLKKTKVTYDFKEIEYSTDEAVADDGTKIPLVIVHKKGLKKNGKNPTILKTYGGYGMLAHRGFDPGIVYFIKKGGVFVYANVRGDGTKGIEWSRAGKRLKKQQTIDDFIDAAEYLVEQKYTKPEKLGITGGSHGGLVVAAASIQRPELFGAVVAEAAPMDMIRFQKYTIGPYNLSEFGTVNDSADFVNLYSYSPYHNIKENINYPSMLISTGDHDDRVMPLHSYKYVARLQNRKAQKNPILLLVEEDAGHYGSSYLKGIINEKANKYGFFLHELSK